MQKQVFCVEVWLIHQVEYIQYFYFQILEIIVVSDFTSSIFYTSKAQLIPFTNKEIVL